MGEVSVARPIRGIVVAGLAGLAIGVTSLAPGAWVGSAAAATGWADFGTPTASSTFATGVSFTQKVTIERALARVELLVTVAGAGGPTVITLPAPIGTGTMTLTHRLDPAVDGYMAPNTPLIARWRLVSAIDPSDVEVGPEVRVTYADDRFNWRTEAGALVRVHWYEGTDAFGARALKIGEAAVRKATELLKVTETDPVDFFVYADSASFYDALGPGARENVGGQANSDIRTMFALISPDEIADAWVGIVIPHELTHLVFDTAVQNPYHFPPRWLNEGLAVYLSQGYDGSDRGAVGDAARSGTLIPLDGLTGQFPTGFERFSLAYAESVSAVDYLVRTHGQESLVSLIRSYAEGRTDGEAFREALGTDMSAFGAAWLDDLGATAPTRHGPQSAPPGPVPQAWLGQAGSSAQPVAPGDGPAASAQPIAPGDGAGSSGGGDALVLVLALVAIAFAGVGVVALVRRRRIDPGSSA